MSDTRGIDLASGDLALRVLPELGGVIASFERRLAGKTVPIFQGIPAQDISFATTDRAASFPMLPFANRAPGNVLRVGDAAYRIEPNTAEPNALHGCAWWLPWHVVSHESQTLEIALDAAPNAYPFAFAATQRFTLRPDGLRMSVRLTNTHDAPIPAGMGLHPYFPRSAGTTLTFAAPRFWLEGPGYLPTDAVTTPPELDFSQGRSIPERWRNNCYSGWDGRAEIAQPDLGYRLSIVASALFRDVMLFTPPGAPTFAFEPQSHTTAATDTATLIAPARPLAALQAGESIAGDVEFLVADH